MYNTPRRHFVLERAGDGMRLFVVTTANEDNLRAQVLEEALQQVARMAAAIAVARRLGDRDLAAAHYSRLERLRTATALEIVADATIVCRAGGPPVRVVVERVPATRHRTSHRAGAIATGLLAGYAEWLGRRVTRVAVEAALEGMALFRMQRPGSA